MSSKSLQQLYDEHTGHVSDKWSLYLSEYERIFHDFRDRQVCVLEIGVQNGGSLDIWSQYFENALVLIGCDINPECEHLSYEDARIHVITGDINKPETSEQVLGYCSTFDIVIDDGSHLSSDIVKSFIRYFPYVAEGGLFIVEDLHCSYWSQFQGGLFDPYSSISFFKRLIDVINYEHWGVEKKRADVLSNILKKYGCEAVEPDLSQIHSIEFINSMCVIRKAVATSNNLGHRLVKGSFEKVFQGNLVLDDLPYEFDPHFSQTDNPYSMVLVPPEELLFQTEQTLAETKQTLAETKQKVINLKNEIDGLRDSTSWRLTVPLRWASKVAKSFARKTAVKSE